MNRKRMRDLANIIEQDALPNVRFNMGVWADKDEENKHWCGTVACIAGYAVVAAYGNAKAKKMSKRDGVMQTAQRILGLTSGEAWQLFTPSGAGHVTAKEAAKALRASARAGEIVWPHRWPY